MVNDASKTAKKLEIEREKARKRARKEKMKEERLRKAELIKKLRLRIKKIQQNIEEGTDEEHEDRGWINNGGKGKIS